MLAAKRREYPDLPCVVLYHGEVAGCSLQNDQTIERGTGISITIDDLKDIGADYFALGHIHKPQHVGELPAYYAGSIYPKNFGETHKAGFNVVDFEEISGIASKTYWVADVTRVDFPHPQNMKIECRFPVRVFDIPDYSAEEIGGKRVWLDITCTKEERALINADEELNHLLERGAVDGSRVTVSDIPTETVRAAEITEVKTPAKKFQVWAANSDVKATESLDRKIKSLENDITRGAVKASGEWELVSVKLRGATGIKKGIKKDEIAINFDDYEPGLISISGANGKGKTTLIENCHPYPQLHTRKGKLQDHFCLRDSFRETVYRNHISGSEVKLLIQIDGQNKSGACKYFIFVKPWGTKTWEPLPGVDGNLKPYEEALHNSFGPVELFLRTAFITQRPTKNLPDLTDATAGEKKALFTELAGIDYLQQFSDVAADNAKREAAKTHDAEIRAQMLENAVGEKEETRLFLETKETLLEKHKAELSEVTEQGKTARADVERLQEAFNAEQTRARQERDARLAVDGAKYEIESLNDEAIRYREAAKNKADYETDIAEYESLQKTAQDENAKKQRISERNLLKQQEFNQKNAAFIENVKELEKERDRLRNNVTDAEKTIAVYKNNIKLYERDAAEIKEDCPTCGQKLPEAKIAELNKKRLEFIEKIEGERTNIKCAAGAADIAYSGLTPIIEKLAELSFDEPVVEKPDAFDDKLLRETTAKLQRVNITEARSLLAKANEAAVRTEGIEAQITDKEKHLAEKETALKAIAARGNPEAEAKLQAARTELDRLTERYSTVKSEIARTEAAIENIKKTLAEIEAKERELETLTKEISLSKTEAADWELLSKAFGRDGIQALELDALAPGISDTANRILASAYGDRFRIEIRTTRIGGAGKKTKQIEDFLIYVIDAEDGEAVLLDDKSGGEAVWIKRAIYDAFAVIRKRNTAFAFLTCFQNETDGALDSASKTAYCRMLEAAHAESKLRHTIIITHSNEVKAMIEQKIEMEDLACKEGVECR
jgi:exonuclease SbcC